MERPSLSFKTAVEVGLATRWRLPADSKGLEERGILAVPTGPRNLPDPST